jgi:chloramphenicol O-acetyltransferase
MRTSIRIYLILLLSLLFISTQTVADENKDELTEAEEMNSCDITEITIPPYLSNSDINYKNERERRDSAPASFRWQSYMPPIRIHTFGAT